MTVAELKAMANKKNISLSVGGKKADIVKALMAVAGVVKPAATRAMVSLKEAVKKSAASLIVKKPAVKKSANDKKSAASKKLTPKKVTPPKRTTATLTSKKPTPKSTVGADNKTKVATTPVREWKLPPGVEEPLMAQERVSESKYYTGSALQLPVATHGELPRSYGEDKIALMMRDPFVAYVYWEATPARLEREKSWFGWDSKLCLRIYDITGVQFDGRNASGYYDQEVFERAGNWYFDFGRPTHSFCADLGLLSPEGKFLTLARSNYITMPRDGVSDVIDEEWMLVDEEFWKLYGYPEGFRRGVSSPEMQEMLRRRRELEITSPGMFSQSRTKKK